MPSPTIIAQSLAAAFVDGDMRIDELVSRGATMLGKRWRWLAPLAERAHNAFANVPRPRPNAVARFILADNGFQHACLKYRLHLARAVPSRGTMSPVAAAKSWQVPSLRNARELADWLGIRIGELEWFADTKGLEQKSNPGRLRNYHYRILHKRFGRIRLIEAPKNRLKSVQRKILADILDQIPVHAAAHGFRRGHSVKSFAAPHVGKRVVLRIDLQDFFPTISVAQIEAIFRTVGYLDSVANLLAGICCNTTPSDVWDEMEVPNFRRHNRNYRFLYARPHLPQGAPTSPALANLCAYRLDCRLSGLAATASAAYTRYADDLAFSGDHDFQRGVHRFHIHACATIAEEGFHVFHHKTRTMRRGSRQRLAGVVVNDRLNIARADFDRLKAILANCIRNGPVSQNRASHPDFRGHLLGQISYVGMLNPQRGQKLRHLLEQINW